MSMYAVGDDNGAVIMNIEPRQVHSRGVWTDYYIDRDFRVKHREKRFTVASVRGTHFTLQFDSGEKCGGEVLSPRGGFNETLQLTCARWQHHQSFELVTEAEKDKMIDVIRKEAERERQ